MPRLPRADERRALSTFSRGLAIVAAVATCGVACASSPAEDPIAEETSPSGPGEGARLPGSSETLQGTTPSTPVPNSTCAATSAAVEPLPLYLVFMFDRSSSMSSGGSPKWTSCTTATKAFFQSSSAAGISASLSFFPKGDDGCDNDLYKNPAVPMEKLPSQALVDAIDRETTDGGTPMRHALQGATRYAAQVAKGMGSNGTVAVVLVTDGLPSGCSNNDIDDVRDVAKDVAPGIRTYVIGVGDLGNLDEIAAAGGTSKALLVSTAAPSQIEQDFLATLKGIRKLEGACEYKIPPPPSGATLDKAKVNVVYTGDDGKGQTVGHAPDCATGAGWRYDDPANPSRVVLCEATCERVSAAPGKVDLAFGCDTQLEVR